MKEKINQKFLVDSSTSLEDRADNQGENMESGIENQLFEEIKKTEILTSNLSKEIESLGGEDGLRNALENSDEMEKANIFDKTRKILYIVSAIVAAPLAMTVFNPEWKSVIHETMSKLANNEVTIGVAATGVLTLTAFMVKEAGGIRNFFGISKEDSTNQNS